MSAILRGLVIFYLLYLALAILVVTTLAAVFMVQILIEDRRRARRGKRVERHGQRMR